MKELVKPEFDSNDLELIYEVQCEYTCPCNGERIRCDEECIEKKIFVDEDTDNLLF